MIVTIDGPAGAGKSSIARQVADELGFEFLDTGAMYRAITLGAIRRQIEFDDIDGLIQYARLARLRWEECRVYLDDVDVTDDIRTPTVTAAIGRIADIAEIRSLLSMQQRKIAEGRDIVTEGRDQGSEVFPDAECKIFLTASPTERAIRRHQQLAEAGRHMAIEDVVAAQKRRDFEDENRPVGALRAADDAILLHSDGMSPDEVLRRAIEIIRATTETAQIRRTDSTLR
ncbi:Cytidylate kinase [Rubripirellula tenax]|uniref:Cytidylate kinase n=1 Tax=Rubripirellula tenax TaxID=2528015 RepID=A0A5C6ECX5_9BACT|nr:(d)CMP kinase [Rubripirellula tenax]TWU46314.1 Cytidylate kinase [Rubripirellula tenax]